MLLPAVGLSSPTPPTAVARRARLYKPMAGGQTIELATGHAHNVGSGASGTSPWGPTLLDLTAKLRATSYPKPPAPILALPLAPSSFHRSGRPQRRSWWLASFRRETPTFW